MYRPPRFPPDRSIDSRTSWRGIVAGYALVAAFPLLLWALSDPLAGATALVATAGLLVGIRRTTRLLRCFYTCGGFVLDLGGRVRICVARPSVDDPCRMGS